MAASRIGIRLLASSLCVVLPLCSCELFLSTLRPPQNPNDSNNPILPLPEFTAETIDTTTVRLSWSIEWGDAGQAPAGVIVIRKTSSAPSHRYDGQAVGWDEAAQSSSLILGDGTFTDVGLEAGSEYWYAAWTYNPEGTHFTGPVYVSSKTQ